MTLWFILPMEQIIKHTSILIALPNPIDQLTPRP